MTFETEGMKKSNSEIHGIESGGSIVSDDVMKRQGDNGKAGGGR